MADANQSEMGRQIDDKIQIQIRFAVGRIWGRI